MTAQEEAIRHARSVVESSVMTALARTKAGQIIAARIRNLAQPIANHLDGEEHAALRDIAEADAKTALVQLLALADALAGLR